ncbi:MAG: hypothetical protein U5J99_12545 [Parvularculaceae bacterium]|nr:hypothetical protein [Parvularculaceae bacterium]
MNMSFAGQAENIAHSILKLMLAIFLSVVCARAIAAPNYVGGIATIDAAMLLYGVITFAAALPQIGLIAVLSLNFRQERPRQSLVLAATIASILATGIGQLIAVAKASAVSITGETAFSAWVALAAVLSGSILTAGVVAHFFQMISMTTQSGAARREILADAFLAAVPTLAAVFVAASAVRLLFH